ncbi:MAG: hypothetical protein FWH55_11740 [Oscillospiraceae bacterium]|nr:hypothetical protein [Oscillospiraceae bacterium]
MQKSRLGISVGFFGAGLYFISLVNIVPLIIMAGYVMIFEQNEWLRRTAVKAVAVYLFFSVISSMIGLITNSSSLLSDFIGFFTSEFSLSVVNRILSICRTALSILQSLLVLMLGFKALQQGTVSFGTLEGTIDKHMSGE